MKRSVILLTAAVFVLFALPLWSQQSRHAEDFLESLQALLEKEDWSSEEIRQLLAEEVDWSRAGADDAVMVAFCLQYARDNEEQIGPHEQAQVRARLAEAVMIMAGQMRSLGFDEQAILRAALNGTREAVNELSQLRERIRSGEDADTGEGDLIRERIRLELQTAMHVEARHMAQSRNREEKQSRPDDLLVPAGPQGPAGPAQ